MQQQARTIGQRHRERESEASSSGSPFNNYLDAVRSLVDSKGSAAVLGADSRVRLEK
jgi:hypothetical protein